MKFTDNYNKARAYAAQLTQENGAEQVGVARAVLLAYGSNELLNETTLAGIKEKFATQVGKNPIIQPDFYSKGVDLAAKMALWGEKGNVRALLCLMTDDRDIPVEENGDICPICGAELEFEGPHEIQEDGTIVSWYCPGCGATGKQGNDIKFAEHIDVCDRDGNKITL